MATLKEIKGRIASVSNTLKITSAMKMVASAKLHRAQLAMENLADYEHALQHIASALKSDKVEINSPFITPHKECNHIAIIAMSSDSSLCGGFNANVAKELERYTVELHAKGWKRVTVIPIGEKIAQATIKARYESDLSYRNMGDNSSYEMVFQITKSMMEQYLTGAVDRVVLIYNHYQSIGKQIPTIDTLLPVTIDSQDGVESEPMASDNGESEIEYIIEPNIERLNEILIPHALRTKLYKTVLDSMVSEHASRMVAMQTATDNATELLEELRLSYNKGRQQAITAELADITQAASNN